jgi:uncharacterized protein with FMN-binding domain
VNPVKKIVMWLMSTISALVLLFGYHTSTSSSAAAAQGGNASVTIPATGSASSGTASASAPTSGDGTTTTVTGTAADTRYGPVQVQLTVANGTITDVTVVEYPNSNGKDQQINAQALPILVKETLSAQSAKIDMVSGATYTSEGYLTSLQSALDQAGL